MNYKFLKVVLVTLLLLGCRHDDALDTELRALIEANNLQGDAATGRTLPSIDEPLAQLGMKLFFTKSLGGEFDSACVSCHHPVFGGGDNLSLSVGIGAIDPDLLGPGRGDASGIPNVPRNAPTTFNIGLWDSSLFWDSRVESLGKEPGQNGAASGISTPDSGQGIADSDAGANLVIAQARFPVTSKEEMRGELQHGANNDALRLHLAGRLGNYGVGHGELLDASWLDEFQAAFGSTAPAEELVTFENIVAALAAYEKSQVFVNNPWRNYVLGDTSALSDDAKRGAILFYTAADQQGGGCVQCHSGDLFSDEQHHAVGAPQFGPGKGNIDDHDFGRENISGFASDRFRFRTPSLLNIAVTAPYTHAGAYETLQQVVAHYAEPDDAVAEFFDRGGWCSLLQFVDIQDCAELYPTARQNSQLALAKIQEDRAANDLLALPDIELDDEQQRQLVAFLEALTDPCVVDRACLAAWIPDPAAAADAHQLDAVDIQGNRL